MSLTSNPRKLPLPKHKENNTGKNVANDKVGTHVNDTEMGMFAAADVIWEQKPNPRICREPHLNVLVYKPF